MTFRVGRSWCLLIGLLLMCREASAQAPDPMRETIWIEAEHLQGVRGYCWPMGQPAMKKTDGHWGLSGPGWAAEWNQGGESGFLSIATAAEDVISCLSVGNIVFAPLLSQWGCRTLGYESSAATSSLLPMRWAFLRGLARQGNHLTATYRSSNFGDSATIFSNSGSYHTPQNIFDVICDYPNVERWKTIDSYPAVIVTGEIELTAAEGERLAKYVAQVGTLVVADGHLTGPGLAALKLPASGPAQVARGYRWRLDGDGDVPVSASQAYRFRPLQLDGPSWRVLAESRDGLAVCAAADRGEGRLIYLSVPYGLGIDERILPIVPRLFAHLSRDQSPVDVRGEVEWLVNRTAQGWLVLLMNPAGQEKPQQGITPTDFRQNRRVFLRPRVPVTTARDRLLPDDRLELRDGTLELEVSVGGVRLIELR